MSEPCTANRHNTISAYRRHGCRCPEAVDIMRRVWRRGERRRWDPIVDEVAVQRAKHGDPIELSIAERMVAVAELTRAGLSAQQIAVRLRVARRTVQRYRGRAAA